MPLCGICGQERDRDKCHIVVLTDLERKQILDTGQEPLDEYAYCKPCWRTMSNKATGTALMKGLFQIRLRQLGVPNAEQVAQKYHDDLVRMSAKEKPS